MKTWSSQFVVVPVLAAAWCSYIALRSPASAQQPQRSSNACEYKVLNAADLFSSQNQNDAIRVLRGNTSAVLDSSPVRAWLLERTLQELGREGWEFVGTAGTDCFVLKRLLQ